MLKACQVPNGTSRMDSFVLDLFYISSAQTFYNLAIIEMALSFIHFHSQSPPVKTPFGNQILAFFICACHSECLSIIPRLASTLFNYS